MITGFENFKAGLLGKTLPHSFSPKLHSYLADYSYELFEVNENELENFIKSKRFNALNVTIPYKKAVLPYLDEISDTAEKIGCVNTIVRKGDKLYGYNTDYYGFMATVKSANIDIKGKKALILGTGGASLTVRAVLESCGALQIINISRSGENNYENLHMHYDAQIIVNATPVGMYPNCDASPIDLAHFKNCEAVFDLIYNPLKTKLCRQADKCGIFSCNGLKMLCFQAKKACEIFCETTVCDGAAEDICAVLEYENKNIVLIGMPSCGKSTLGEILGRKLGRCFVDTDRLIEDKAKMSIPQIFEKFGEEYFRKLETQVLYECALKSGLVISTGGGVVTQNCNLDILRQNSICIFIKRDLNKLCDNGRPLSKSRGIETLYNERLPLYKEFAEWEIDNNGDIENCTNKIIEHLQIKLKGALKN